MTGAGTPATRQVRRRLRLGGSLVTMVIAKASRPAVGGKNRVTAPRWPLAVCMMLGALAVGCADGGESADLAPTAQSRSAESSSTAPGGDTERPDDVGDVVETTNTQDCINEASAANDEFAALSTQADVNLTRAASPELVDFLATVWADCLGTAGVSQVISAELLISGSPVPPDTAPCLTTNAVGDEAALMRHYFALVREEPPAEDVQTLASGHLASCVPGSLLWDGQLPVPLDALEVQCLDDSYRSSPEFAAYFRAPSYGGSLTEAEDAALAERAYECLDIANQVLAPLGGDAGISDGALDCVDTAARSFGFLRGGITADNQGEFQDRVGACFTADDIATINGR